MSKIQTVAQVEFLGGTLHVEINRARRIDIKSNDYNLVMQGIEEVLIPGKNTIRASLKLTDENVQPIQFRVRIAKLEMNGMVSTEMGEQLALLSWKRDDDVEPRQGGDVIKMEAEFYLPEEGIWDWPWKTKLTVDQDLRDELQKTTEELRNLFQTRDSQKILEMFAPYHDAMELNYGPDESYRRDDLRDILSYEGMPWIYNEIMIDSYTFRMTVENKLVELSDGTGQPLIRLKTFNDPDDGPQELGFPIFLWRAEDGRLLPAF